MDLRKKKRGSEMEVGLDWVGLGWVELVDSLDVQLCRRNFIIEETVEKGSSEEGREEEGVARRKKGNFLFVCFFICPIF